MAAHKAFVKCKTTVTDTVPNAIISTPRRLRNLGRQASRFVASAGGQQVSTVRKAVQAAIGGAGKRNNVVHRVTGMVFVTVSTVLLVMSLVFLVVAINRAQVKPPAGQKTVSEQDRFVRWCSILLCVVSFLVWFLLLAKKRNMDTLLNSALGALRHSVTVIEQGTRGRAASVETHVRAGTDFKGAREAIQNFLWTALLFPAAVYAVLGLAAAVVGATELAPSEYAKLSWSTHFAFGLGLGLCVLGCAGAAVGKCVYECLDAALAAPIRELCKPPAPPAPPAPPKGYRGRWNSTTEAPALTPRAAADQTLAAGDRVQVWWADEGQYFQGTVTATDTEAGTCDIAYDDGDEGTGEAVADVMRLEHEPATDSDDRAEDEGGGGGGDGGGGGGGAPAPKADAGDDSDGAAGDVGPSPPGSPARLDGTTQRPFSAQSNALHLRMHRCSSESQGTMYSTASPMSDHQLKHIEKHIDSFKHPRPTFGFSAAIAEEGLLRFSEEDKSGRSSSSGGGGGGDGAAAAAAPLGPKESWVDEVGGQTARV